MLLQVSCMFVLPQRQSTQASLEPADKEPQKKRLHIPLPPISMKQPKVQLKKLDHSTKDQVSLIVTTWFVQHIGLRMLQASFLIL